MAKKGIKKFYKILMVLMLALQFLPAFSTPVVAATGEASNWAEFKSLVNSGATEITITDDILMEETLTISNTLTIKGNKTIYYKEGLSSYDSMFKVVSGGDLTLGGTIKLSGKKGKCNGGGSSTSSQSAKLQFDGSILTKDMNYFLYGSGTPVYLMYDTSALTFEVDSEGYVTYNGNYIGPNDGGYYVCNSSITKEKAAKLVKTSDWSSFNGLVAGETYALMQNKSQPYTYVGWDTTESRLKETPSTSEVEPFTPVDIVDNAGAPTPCTMSSSCATWTNTEFDGDLDNPKGFFVQVEQGGKATLDGATLEHFYTDTTKAKTPRHVAPVVANGGTFDIKSGSIQNNVVGYIADDSKSNQNANAIKTYVKGAAPNAPRKGDLATKDNRRRSKAGIDAGDAGSGITGTAGAVREFRHHQ